ncbi:hypothetical protein SLS62_008479 [Diatrype stigma]|uniref:Uncharacterized protein n=1 Tax=Diatrype stigma TaxID=117547 RepID=A0AAN9UT60_9PEZI
MRKVLSLIGAIISGQGSTHSSADKTKSEKELAQMDETMGSHTKDNANRISSHRRVSSEPMIELNRTPASREASKRSTTKCTMEDEHQKKAKYPGKGTQLGGAGLDSQEDESSEGKALKARLSSQDQTIKALEKRLAYHISKREDAESANRFLEIDNDRKSHNTRNLEHHLESVNTELQDLQKEYWELEDRNEHMTDEIKQLRAQWIGATEELGRLQKIDRKHAIDDEAVMAIWNNLVCTIHTLASRASACKGNLVAPTTDQREKFGFLAPYFGKYFPSHPSVLFEAYIWSRISYILNAPSMIWSHEAGRAVRLVTDSIIHHDKLTTELRGILQKLFDFCSTTARAKAAYIAFSPRCGFIFRNGAPRIFGFEEDTMEFRETTSPQKDIIDFVISPGLVKHGNSDGEDYDQHTILDKARVTI